MRKLPDKNECDGTGIQHVRRLGPYITHIINLV